ncbi:hypothetical protein J2Z62_000727 [Mycoplasmoides fastidiosum]|uniref:Uncharacterized protein n=1 Tax=Mycoplasmoides fastidiosum TaxID=92758 RepID=A0ABU0M020_9BACT|nr:hypothetical protein [Mycoplasmoides fastidiosum]MDQ0514289.1 hypothetical protein [Mycoplasmoides fastidiosum]UUD38105.1 hypothetical protein NPA10_01835 [Mycoplasmoides fastidiosum]
MDSESVALTTYKKRNFVALNIANAYNWGSTKMSSTHFETSLLLYCDNSIECGGGVDISSLARGGESGLGRIGGGGGGWSGSGRGGNVSRGGSGWSSSGRSGGSNLGRVGGSSSARGSNVSRGGSGGNSLGQGGNRIGKGSGSSRSLKGGRNSPSRSNNNYKTSEERYPNRTEDHVRIESEALRIKAELKEIGRQAWNYGKSMAGNFEDLRKLIPEITLQKFLRDDQNRNRIISYFDHYINQLEADKSKIEARISKSRRPVTNMVNWIYIMDTEKLKDLFGNPGEGMLIVIYDMLSNLKEFKNNLIKFGSSKSETSLIRKILENWWNFLKLEKIASETIAISSPKEIKESFYLKAFA